MSNIGKLMKQIPEITKRAELHDQISVKTLEIVNEMQKELEEIHGKINIILNLMEKKQK